MKRMWFWISLLGAFVRGFVGCCFILAGLIDCYIDGCLGKFSWEGWKTMSLGILMMPPWDNGWRDYNKDNAKAER